MGSSTSRRPAVLAVGALGVVFGDVGTSPLYALRSALGEQDGLSRTTVYGTASLMVWALVVVVTVLYVGLLLGTDNEGEGGLLALVALLRRTTRTHRLTGVATGLGMVGAALFLGDCVVTPAISVLSAAEGLTEASDALQPVVLPFALVVLAGVFVLQRVGSGRIGAVYGPVMIGWFLVLGATGLAALSRHPDAVRALSPVWAVRLAVDDPVTTFLSLGSVVLAVTGAEALYADLGHFGRRAVTTAWFVPVLPALVLGYLGEAGTVVAGPAAATDPFFAVVPGWATVPVVVLATLATIIASEAVIAGAFTVLHQAAGLGLLPSLRTEHPSERHAGQIYVPAANWTLAVAVLAVVVGFRSSERLASAYGVAVGATLTVTTVLYLGLLHARHGWRSWRMVPGVLCLVAVVLLLAGTLPKVPHGGWVPTGIAVLLLVVMTSWVGGRRHLAAARGREEGSPSELLADVGLDDLRREPGAIVFLTHDADIAPLALRALVDVSGSLPEHVVLLSWQVADTPHASPHETVVEVERFEDCWDGVAGVEVTLGYRERLDIAHVLEVARERHPEGLDGVDPDTAFYVVSRAVPRLHRPSRLARWRQRTFLVLDRLATDPAEQIGLPPHRTITVGRELDL